MAKKTNLKCWMCDFIFDDPPKFIPTYIKNIADDKIEVGVLGNMCSFACTNKYISTNFHRKIKHGNFLITLLLFYINCLLVNQFIIFLKHLVKQL